MLKSIINLKEIKEGGEDFEISRKDSEITLILDDLLKGALYQAHVHIMPAGQAFDLKGKISTKFSDVCSFCSAPVQLPISGKIHQILMLGTKSKCDIKTSGHEFETNEVDVQLLNTHLFNLGECLREELALLQPLQPLCKPDCLGLCPTCGVDKNTESCLCVAAKISQVSPFSVLKTLKLS